MFALYCLGFTSLVFYIFDSELYFVFCLTKRHIWVKMQISLGYKYNKLIINWSKQHVAVYI